MFLGAKEGMSHPNRRRKTCRLACVCGKPQPLESSAWKYLIPELDCNGCHTSFQLDRLFPWWSRPWSKASSSCFPKHQSAAWSQSECAYATARSCLEALAVEPGQAESPPSACKHQF